MTTPFGHVYSIVDGHVVTLLAMTPFNSCLTLVLFGHEKGGPDSPPLKLKI